MTYSLVSFAAARDSDPSGARAVAKETIPSPDQACFIFTSLISGCSKIALHNVKRPSKTDAKNAVNWGE